MSELSAWDNDPKLYLFTSLTAGSSHIVTATSRIETILKANKIPFEGVDTATNDSARKLFGRRARGKKLPFLVKEGFVIGDLEEIEEWNEYGELKEVIGPAPSSGASVAPKPPTTQAPTTATATAPPQKENKPPPQSSEATLAMRQLSAEAAAVGAARKPVPANISTTNPLLAEKVNTPNTDSKPTSTPIKSDPSGILSPRNVPLPATPGPSVSEGKSGAGEGEGGRDTISDKGAEILKGLPKPTGEYNAKLPPSKNVDDEKSDVSEAPIAVSHPAQSPPARSTRSPSEVAHHRSSSISEASPDEIKQIEQEQAIAEVSSSEEEDDESDEEEEEEEEARGKPPVKGPSVEKEEEEEHNKDSKEEQDQGAVPRTVSAKAADKAGESVQD